ncbi:MAG: hypothetical protein MUP16_04900 [Sedimentisphaerales bacterium]|nr:hypothetical protein [Sedimentisphaerales bacterium]
MVAYAIDEITKPKTGYICPKCFRELAGPAVAGERDRYGRITRSYFGWCFECDIGFEVVQFKLKEIAYINCNCTGDKNIGYGLNGWLINKYRLFKKLEGSDKPQPVTAWLTMNPLPEPAPVITGPGKEYDKPFEPETIDLMEVVLAALKATTKTVESLLKLIIDK